MKRDGEKEKINIFELNFNQTIIKIIHPFCGVRLNTMDPMMLIKPWSKNQSKTARKYSQNNNIYNIYIKGLKKESLKQKIMRKMSIMFKLIKK